MERKTSDRMECKECHQMFSPAYLHVHRRIHTGEKPYKCSLCDKRFMFHSGIQYHTKKVHSHQPGTVEKRLEYEYSPSINTTASGMVGARCTICQRLFPNKTALRAHSRIHTQLYNVPYECATCHKEFTDSEAYIKHMCVEPVYEKVKREPVKGSSSEVETRVKCLHCSKSFCDDNKLAAHMKVHSVDKLLMRCSVCYKFFRNSENLRVHVENEHKNAHFSCKKCGKQFSKRFRLDIHMRSHSVGGGVSSGSKDEKMANVKHEQCSVCRKMFADRRSLILHALIHVRPTKIPHRCTVCSATFKRQQHLLLHSRIHEFADSRPFRCPRCPAGFMKELPCRMHMNKIHNIAFGDEDIIVQKQPRVRGVEVHECVLCWKILDSQNDLVNHMKVHKSTSDEKQPRTTTIVHDEHRGKGSTEKDPKVTPNKEDTIDAIAGLKPEKIDDTPTDCFSAAIDKTKTPNIPTATKLKMLNKDILERYTVDGDKITKTSTCRVTGKQIFVCNICQTTFTMKENFKRHVKNRAYDHGAYMRRKTVEDEMLSMRLGKRKKIATESEKYYRRLLVKQALEASERIHAERKNDGKNESKNDGKNESKNEGQNEGQKDKALDVKKMKRYKYVCDVCGLSYTRKLNMRQHRNKHTDEAFRRAGVRREDFPLAELDITRDVSGDKNDTRTGTFKGFDVYMDTDEVPDYEELVEMSKSNSDKPSETSVESDIVIDKSESLSNNKSHDAPSLNEKSMPYDSSKVNHCDTFLTPYVTQAISTSGNNSKRTNENTTGTMSEAISPPNNASATRPDNNDVPTEMDKKHKTPDKATISKQDSGSSETVGKTKVCPECTLPFLEKQKTIGCKLCSTRFCVTCSGVPREVYELALVDEDTSPVVWLCRVCKPLFPKFTMLLHQLGEFEESIDDRIADMEKKLKMMKNNQRLLYQSSTKKTT